MKVAAVLLAAGGGSRFRESAEQAGVTAPHKLLAPLADSTVVEHAFSALSVGAPADAPRLVVAGAVPLPELPGATVLRNPKWADGQATSLWMALDAAAALGCTGVVVGLGDQPFLRSEAWSHVFAALGRGAEIAVATYDGRRRNPVGLHRNVWPLIPTVGDEGARSLLAGRPELVTEVACSGNPADIDTAEDLLRWS